MSMFIANGISAKKEVSDFLNNVAELAKFVSDSDWHMFQRNMTNEASQMIVVLKSSGGHGSSHRSSHGSSHGSSRGCRNRSKSPRIPTLKVSLPTSLRPRIVPGNANPGVVFGVPGVGFGVPGVVIHGNPFIVGHL